ncbi:protein-methionine-sulfoxide reductase heme-binding subunit MsrQ [Salipiger sp.]|uniref:protein-methionine-sulfoxide reductase heme-binding subunit MsrQ n=1 Tax=Salipiger sp. TaxID=2078585 RepID=UPI003A982241
MSAADSRLAGLRDGVVGAVNRTARKVPAGALYIMCPIPAAWLLWQGLTGGLGFEPIKALEHQLGEWALQLLIAGLCITPLRRYAGLNLLKFRRAIGLIAFLYVVLHFLVWMVLDVQLPSQIWADIVKRPYITIGMAALVLLIPLAATSNNLSVRRLGRTWRSLHKATYVVALLAALHYILLAKGFRIEPLVYAGIIGGLLLLRLPAAVNRSTTRRRSVG